MKQIIQHIAKLWNKITGKSSPENLIKEILKGTTKEHPFGLSSRRVFPGGLPGLEAELASAMSKPASAMSVELPHSSSTKPQGQAQKKPRKPKSVTGLTTIAELTEGKKPVRPIKVAPSKSVTTFKGEGKSTTFQLPKSPAQPSLSGSVQAYFKKLKPGKTVRVGQVLTALNIPKEKEATLRTTMFELKRRGILDNPAKGLFARGAA